MLIIYLGENGDKCIRGVKLCTVGLHMGRAPEHRLQIDDYVEYSYTIHYTHNDVFPSDTEGVFRVSVQVFKYDMKASMSCCGTQTG